MIIYKRQKKTIKSSNYLAEPFITASKISAKRIGTLTTEKPSVEISTEDIRRALHGLRLFYAAIDLAREDSAASKELFEKSKNLTSKAEEASRIIGAYCLKHGFDARFVGVDMARKICQSNQSKELP